MFVYTIYKFPDSGPLTVKTKKPSRKLKERNTKGTKQYIIQKENHATGLTLHCAPDSRRTNRSLTDFWTSSKGEALVSKLPWSKVILNLIWGLTKSLRSKVLFLFTLYA